MGYGVGKIPIGGETIHDRLGDGIYYVSAGIYDAGAAVCNGASAVWNWITTDSDDEW
jgi:hypothetical protein